MAVDDAIGALRQGLPILLPTDTVYGLAGSAGRAEDAERVYRLKGRSGTEPTALLTATVDALLDCIPELRGRAEAIVRALLPGPYTLVLPNPARRYHWLAGERPEAIGVRVPLLPEPARRVAEAVACLLATSANEPGGPSPASLDEVPERIRAGCAAEVDAGLLPGTPSTVLDFTGPRPVVIREGAADAAGAIGRLAALGLS